MWGRFAAFAGRSAAPDCTDLPLRIQIYVDDPVVTAAGSSQTIALSMTCALLWLCILGLPLAWHKSVWIGAHIFLEGHQAVISIPENKLKELSESVQDTLHRAVTLRRLL